MHGHLAPVERDALERHDLLACELRGIEGERHVDATLRGRCREVAGSGELLALSVLQNLARLLVYKLALEMICLAGFKAVILNNVDKGDLVGKRRLVQPGLLLGERGAQVGRVEAHRLVGVRQVAVRGHELPGIVTLAVARFDIELLESNCLACLDAGDTLEGHFRAAAALVSRKLHACFQGLTRSVLVGLAGLCVMERADDSIGLTNCNVFIDNRIDEIDGARPHDGMRPVCGCERRTHARHVHGLCLVGDIGMHGELASLAGERLEGDDCFAC